MNIKGHVGLNNFKFISKDDTESIKYWISQGFVIEENCDIFRFVGDIHNNHVMTKKPKIFTKNDAQQIIGKKIEGVNDSFGTYGMGGLGFLGFKFYECGVAYWLIIGIGSCDLNITLDGRVFSCNKREQCQKLTTWYYGFAHHPEKSRDAFFSYLCTMLITDISYTGKNFSMKLKDAFANYHHIKASTDYEQQVYIIADGTDLIDLPEYLIED